MEKRLVVILKNGLRFEHHPPVSSEEQWVDFVADIGSAIGIQKGNLRVHGPTGVYDLSEVASIQFGAAEDPPPDKLPMGFQST